jgi:HNH endonuclease
VARVVVERLEVNRVKIHGKTLPSKWGFWQCKTVLNEDHPINLQRRFWNKVHIGTLDECWPWTASKNRQGYGYFGINGKIYKAHRTAYRFSFGPFDQQKDICHHCDNPCCCNPNHLFLGTVSDNMRDCLTKGRGNKPFGERIGLSKLTADKVRAMRSIYTQGGLRIVDVAAQFGVCFSTARTAIRGITWRHVIQ